VPRGYLQVYHPEKPLARRIFCTKPGWCFICSCIFFVANTFFVFQETFFPGEGDGQNRACAPIDNWAREEQEEEEEARGASPIGSKQLLLRIYEG
jgi:hypothetical protein